MSPSKNTLFFPAKSTETTTFSLSPSASYYVTQNGLENTSNVLFTKINDNFDKLHEALEYINALIANQDVKVEKK